MDSYTIIESDSVGQEGSSVCEAMLVIAYLLPVFHMPYKHSFQEDLFHDLPQH